MQTHYVDAHLHLQDPRFEGSAPKVLARAKEAGVGLLFCNRFLPLCFSADASPAFIEFTKSFAASIQD